MCSRCCWDALNTEMKPTRLADCHQAKAQGTDIAIDAACASSMGLYHQTRPGVRRHGRQTAEYPIGDAKAVDWAKKAIGDATTDAEKVKRLCKFMHDSSSRPGRRPGVRSKRERWQDRLTLDSKVLIGKPVIKRTRITVESVSDLLGRDWTTEQILREYDHLRPKTFKRVYLCQRSAQIRAGSFVADLKDRIVRQRGVAWDVRR
jgi:uncharacterized protein (DUF433 family)